MSTNTLTKLQHEVNSLQGLSIINLVCSALALAFGVYFLMPNLISVATTLTVTINQVGMIILGGLTFAVAIRWLISCAEIIDASSTIASSLSDHKKNNTLDDNSLTGLIVDMTATYRENKPTLKLMTTISKIAGVCFAISALLALVSIVTGLNSGAELWSTLLMVANMAIGIATSAACFIIPRFFGKYSQVWDERLKQSSAAEAALKRQLGEVA
jgi:hypothetical protein